jgi:flavin-dependent dehydrogenase
MKSFDAIIVGAGPAGSALAALLARQGQKVALVERDRLPRDKLCGEFLSPEARSLFQRIGCLDRVLGLSPATIGRARFTTTSGQALELDLPGEGLGLSRRALDHTLFEFAGECGAHTFTDAEVRDVDPFAAGVRSSTTVTVRFGAQRNAPEEWRAPLTVLAHGRCSGLDRRLGRAFPARTHGTLGFKRHMRVSHGDRTEATLRAIENTVEIHTFAGGYCGLCFVERRRVNVCAFVDRRLTRKLSAVNWDELVTTMRARNAVLDARFHDLSGLDEPALAVAEVPLCARESRLGSVPIIGDSAGMVAPLCGGGQVTALRSALAVAEICDTHAVRDVAEVWEQRWRKEFSRAFNIGRVLHLTLTHGRLASLGIGVAQRAPALGRWLVSATRSATETHTLAADLGA